MEMNTCRHGVVRPPQLASRGAAGFVHVRPSARRDPVNFVTSDAPRRTKSNITVFANSRKKEDRRPSDDVTEDGARSPSSCTTATTWRS